MLGILEICCGFNAQLCASKAICVFDVNTPNTTILNVHKNFKKSDLKQTLSVNLTLTKTKFGENLYTCGAAMKLHKVMWLSFIVVEFHTLAIYI